MELFKRLVTWTLVILLTALCGCGAVAPTVDPATELEMLLIAETSRFAGMMGVQVRGEITDQHYTGIGPSGPWEATGWYQAGVAYYNRGMVAKTVSIDVEPYKETASNVACHEVAHALEPQHDIKHWTLMSRYCVPTYPRP